MWKAKTALTSTIIKWRNIIKNKKLMDTSKLDPIESAFSPEISELDIEKMKRIKGGYTLPTICVYADGTPTQVDPEESYSEPD